MSDKETAALKNTHPKLHEAVTRGPLMEANPEFVSVAERYPAK